MASYTIMKSNKTGRWMVVEKKYKTVVAKFDTRDEACAEIARLKEEAKARTAEKKAQKAEVEEIAKTFPLEGLTPSGKRYDVIGNCGLENRSRHCYTLYVDNECIFTSGDLGLVIDYVRKH